MAQYGHGDGRRKKSKTREDGSYQTVQAGHEKDEERKARLEKILLVTTQLRLVLETEEERR